MFEDLFSKLEQPSPTFSYPSTIPNPDGFCEVFSAFVRANHARLLFIDPPTREDTFEVVREGQQIIAIANQGVRVYFIALNSANSARSLERQRDQGLVLRLDYLKLPTELLD